MSSKTKNRRWGLLGLLGLGGAVLGLVAYRMHRQGAGPDADPGAEPVAPPATPLGDVLDLDDVHVEFSPDLVGMALDPGTGLDARIANMRTHVARVFGLILPDIRLTDQAELPPGVYLIRVHGVEQARGSLHPDLVLALMPDAPQTLPSGQDVTEPVYGAPARWISPRDQETAALNGATGRINGEIAVAGYSYEDALDEAVLSFGTLADVKGLEGQTEVARLAVTTLPGDAGGPVLDACGDVIGMLLPRRSTNGRVLPDDVGFALKSKVISEALANGGAASAQPASAIDDAGAPRRTLAAEDITTLGRDMTVLVSCWN